MTARHPIKPTSPRCHSAWQPNPGRRSTYRRGKTVQTTETTSLLIVYYLIFMVVGDFAAYFLGRFVEYEWGSHVSLIVFLALYFLFLWVSWVLAVRFTKPKAA